MDYHPIMGTAMTKVKTRHDMWICVCPIAEFNIFDVDSKNCISWNFKLEKQVESGKFSLCNFPR